MPLQTVLFDLSRIPATSRDAVYTQIDNLSFISSIIPGSNGVILGVRAFFEEGLDWERVLMLPKECTYIKE